MTQTEISGYWYYHDKAISVTLCTGNTRLSVESITKNFGIDLNDYVMRGGVEFFGRGHTRETGNRNATAISENCYQPELNTCYWMEQRKLWKRQRNTRKDWKSQLPGNGACQSSHNCVAEWFPIVSRPLFPPTCPLLMGSFWCLSSFLLIDKSISFLHP
jgi:hypothetical protein